jgi:hypothetical protein
MTRMVPLDRLDAVSFQPEIRTSARALSSLLEEIRRDGMLSPIHVIAHDNRYMIVDGHRRAACLQEIAAGANPGVMVVVHDLPSSHALRLWQSLSMNRKVSAYEWMCVWHKQNGKGHYPSSIRGQLNSCIAQFGQESIGYLVEHGISPAVSLLVRNLMAQYDRNASLDPPKPLDALHWLVDHKGQATVHGLLALGAIRANVLRRLAACIRSGRSFGTK